MEEAAIREPRVTLRYFDGCPNWGTAYQRLNEALAETGFDELTVALELVETPEEAERLRFAGSPTILLDGDDAFAGDTTAARRCRCARGDRRAPRLRGLTFGGALGHRGDNSSLQLMSLVGARAVAQLSALQGSRCFNALESRHCSVSALRGGSGSRFQTGRRCPPAFP